MKHMNQIRKFGYKFAAGTAAAMAAAGAFAADSTVQTIDASGAVSQVGAGGASSTTLGIAMVGFCALIGVLVKMRRAGS